MPSIDLARLRKQAARLADFFFAPDAFTQLLSSTLDSYVNYTARGRRPAAPGNHLPTYRTPVVVMRQIEHELEPLASAGGNAAAALALADRLWDESWLESRLLAAFVLGHIPPEEAPLLARLTAWISQIRDPDLRSRLLDACLFRMRTDAPDMFLHLVREWLRPERQRLWPAAIQAAIAAGKDTSFANLPALIESLEPALRAAPAEMQLEFEELLVTLFRASATETSYLIQHVLLTAQNEAPGLLFRRMGPALPRELQDQIRDAVRTKPAAAA